MTITGPVWICDCGAHYSNLGFVEACQINNHGQPPAASPVPASAGETGADVARVEAEKLVDMCRQSRAGIKQESHEYNFDHSRAICIRAITEFIDRNTSTGDQAAARIAELERTRAETERQFQEQVAIVGKQMDRIAELEGALRSISIGINAGVVYLRINKQLVADFGTGGDADLLLKFRDIQQAALASTPARRE